MSSESCAPNDHAFTLSGGVLFCNKCGTVKTVSVSVVGPVGSDAQLTQSPEINPSADEKPPPETDIDMHSEYVPFAVDEKKCMCSYVLLTKESLSVMEQQSIQKLHPLRTQSVLLGNRGKVSAEKVWYRQWMQWLFRSKGVVNTDIKLRILRRMPVWQQVMRAIIRRNGPSWAPRVEHVMIDRVRNAVLKKNADEKKSIRSKRKKKNAARGSNVPPLDVDEKTLQRFRDYRLRHNHAVDNSLQVDPNMFQTPRRDGQVGIGLQSLLVPSEKTPPTVGKTDGLDWNSSEPSANETVRRL